LTLIKARAAGDLARADAIFVVSTLAWIRCGPPTGSARPARSGLSAPSTMPQSGRRAAMVAW